MNSHASLSRLGGSGPDVVLIHGYGADRFTWLTTTPALLNRASVWLLDLPAHGKNQQDCGDGSLSSMVDLVKSSLHDAGLQQAHLVGHSLGARIAMEIASQMPEQVQSLFLISPAGVGGSINMEFLSNFHSAEDEHSIIELLQTLVHDPRMISRSLGGRVLAYLERSGTRSNLQRIAAGLLSAQDDVQSTLIRLSETDIPCAGIWGKEDRINPPDEAFTTQLPGELHLLEGCGHLPHLEHSTTVNRVLRNFHGKLPTQD